jgi:PAS domain S-box-containing protein
MINQQPTSFFQQVQDQQDYASESAVLICSTVMSLIYTCMIAVNYWTLPPEQAPIAVFWNLVAVALASVGLLRPNFLKIARDREHYLLVLYMAYCFNVVAVLCLSWNPLRFSNMVIVIVATTAIRDKFHFRIALLAASLGLLALLAWGIPEAEKPFAVAQCYFAMIVVLLSRKLQSDDVVVLTKTRLLAQWSRSALEAVNATHSEAVIHLDKNANIISLSDLAVGALRHSRSKLIGKNLHEVAHVKTAGPSDCILCMTMQENELVSSLNGHLLRGDGVVFPVSLNYSRISSRDQENLGTVVTFRDISLEQELSAAKMNALADSIHELRTPLTSIMGMSDLLLGVDLSNEKRIRYAQVINGESQTLLGLIQTYLRLERVAADPPCSTYEKIDAVLVFREILREKAVGDRLQYFEALLPDSAFPVYCDRDSFAELLRTILEGGPVEPVRSEKSVLQFLCAAGARRITLLLPEPYAFTDNLANRVERHLYLTTIGHLASRAGARLECRRDEVLGCIAYEFAFGMEDRSGIGDVNDAFTQIPEN